MKRLFKNIIWLLGRQSIMVIGVIIICFFAYYIVEAGRYDEIMTIAIWMIKIVLSIAVLIFLYALIFTDMTGGEGK